MKYLLLLLLVGCECVDRKDGGTYTCPSARYEPAPTYKTVIGIESCASSGRCRVIFDDGSSDLLYLPHIGQKVQI